MTDFRVWASLGIKGDALEKMAKFSRLTTEAYAHIAKLEKALALISPQLDTLAKSFAFMRMEAMESNGVMARLDKTLSSASARTTVLSTKADRLARSLEMVAAKGSLASESLGAMSAVSMGSASHSRRRGHLSTRHLGSVGLGAIAEPVGTLGAGMYLGGAPIAAAAGIGYLTYAGFEKQKEFQQQVQQLRGSGLTDDQLKEAQRIAYTPTKGISSIEKIKSLNDAFMATKDWKEAKVLAPMLAQAEFAANATFRGMTDQQRQALVKFAEMRAGSDLAKIPAAMDLGYKMMNASAGTLDPKQQAIFMRRAATAGYHLTDRGYAALEPVMQELTGTITGTGYQSGYQMLATGAGTLNNKKRVKDLLSLGIYKGAQKDKDGRYTSTAVDPKLLTLYGSDPVAFTKKVIDIYREHGTTSTDDINRRLALDFPRLTANFMTLIEKNMGKIDRQVGLFDKQQGIQSSFKEALNIPTGSSQALSNSWTNLAVSFGKISSPLVQSGMSVLTRMLDRLTSVFSNFSSVPKGTEGMIPLSDTFKKKSWKPITDWLSTPVQASILSNHNNSLQKNAFDYRGSNAPIVVHNHIQLDGNSIASQVTTKITRMANPGGAMSSTSTVNSGLTILPPAYNNAGNW